MTNLPTAFRRNQLARACALLLAAAAAAQTIKRIRREIEARRAAEAGGSKETGGSKAGGSK